jgi:hypothetical protein
MTLRKREDTAKWRQSTNSHSVENWLSKTLWAGRKTDYVMNEWFRGIRTPDRPARNVVTTPTISEPINTVSIQVKSYRYWRPKKKTPPEHISSKHPHSPSCYRETITKLTARLNPRGQCQVISLQIHLCTQRREIATALKSKYCWINMSVRQDTATRLLKPKYYTVLKVYLFSFSISSSVVSTNKSASKDSAVFQGDLRSSGMLRSADF